MRIAGIILAGGEGARIGGGKALRPFGGASLIDAVIARVKDQVDTLALNISSGEVDVYRARYANGCPLIPDAFAAGTGPLAGVVAGMEWANTLAGIEWLATFPCDTPFLPGDLVKRLVEASKPGRPVAAEDGERLHGVCAIWPVSCLPRLRAGVEQGQLRSLFSALEVLNGTRCRFDDAEAFFNVNTTADLERAEAIAASRG